MGVILKLSAMVFVGVEIGGDDDAVAELSARQSLLGFLAICNTVELYKHLKNKDIFRIRLNFKVHTNRLTNKC